MWGYVAAMQEEEEERRRSGCSHFLQTGQTVRLWKTRRGRAGQASQTASPTLEARYKNNSKTVQATNISDCPVCHE